MTKRITALVITVAFAFGALAPVGSAQYGGPYGTGTPSSQLSNLAKKRNCKKKARKKARKAPAGKKRKRAYRRALKRCLRRNR